MLDQDDATSLIDERWEAAQHKTQLPEDFTAFCRKRGPAPLHFGTRRAYQRFFLRHKAVLCRQETQLAVYTKDISRQGVGILTPIQLFPLEHVELQLPSGVQYRLEIARCRRIEVDCYECGTRFVLKPH